MLKKFFITMLGTMAGFWISLGLLVLCGLALAVSAIGGAISENTPKVKKESVLVIDLRGVVEERFQPKSLMNFLQDSEQNAPTLDELLTAVRQAINDKKIDGIYLKCKGSAMGAASREELLEALRDFSNAGKWIVAYSDNYGQGDYFLATCADSLILNPMGSVDIHGLGGSISFFTGLLDKLGVKMQIVKVGTYKSAVEPYILKQMSDPARRQTQQYIDTVWSYMARNIAENRGIEKSAVTAMASDYMSYRSGQVFVDSALVTSLAYERSVDDVMREILGKDKDEDINFVSLSDYIQSDAVKNMFGKMEQNHIAVYYAFGEIVDSGSEGIVGPDMVSDIVSLADDDNVRGLILRVNSPGGSAFASEQIWEALEYFKSKDKPYYVSMGDYAASGGYYISCGADRIFADYTTLTGSIGVFGMIPDFSGLVTDKIGITFSTVETNPDGASYNGMHPLSEGQYAALQKSVESVYDTFTGRVAAGRDMDVDSVKAIAEGRVWIGIDALNLGLVDEIGSLHSAIEYMAAELDISSDHIVAYPENEEKMWMTILRQSGEFSKADMSMPYDAKTLQVLSVVKKLRTLNPVQARMEPIVLE